MEEENKSNFSDSKLRQIENAQDTENVRGRDFLAAHFARGRDFPQIFDFLLVLDKDNHKKMANNAVNAIEEQQKKVQRRFLSGAGVVGFFPFPQQLGEVFQRHEDPEYICLNDNCYYHCGDGFLLPLLVAQENAFPEGEPTPGIGGLGIHHFICPVRSDDFRLYHDLMRKAFDFSPKYYTEMFQRRVVDWGCFRILMKQVQISEKSYAGSWFQTNVYDLVYEDEDAPRTAEDFFEQLDLCLRFWTFNTMLLRREETVFRYPCRDVIVYPEKQFKKAHNRALRKRVATWEDLCVDFRLKF